MPERYQITTEVRQLGELWVVEEWNVNCFTYQSMEKDFHQLKRTRDRKKCAFRIFFKNNYFYVNGFSYGEEQRSFFLMKLYDVESNHF